MIFSTLDWNKIQPGLAWHEPGDVRGSVAIFDATGIARQCEVDLKAGLRPDGRERLVGTICQSIRGGDSSCVELQLDLQTDVEMHLTQLIIRVHEKSAYHREMSVALACTGTLVHWVVQYLALKLKSGWLLQLELDKDNLTDRVASKLMEELLLACELTAESVEDCAACLPPLGIVG